jgi:hypothetical protein
MAMEGIEGESKFRYRRYTLVIRELLQGWGVWIEDPAGHVADVVLHEHLAISHWDLSEEARGAAERYVDELLSEESSY